MKIGAPTAELIWAEAERKTILFPFPEVARTGPATSRWHAERATGISTIRPQTSFLNGNARAVEEFLRSRGDDPLHYKITPP